MSRIRSKDTNPEIVVRKFLFSMGFRYRLHDSKLPGKPDIILPKYKTAIFVHGCFWHNHEGCKRANLPKSNLDYWIPKIERNKKRDVENQAKLAALGWHIIVIYECQLKAKVLSDTLNKVVNELNLLKAHS
ncbi:very short patch repair endonuclease [Nibrella viscosa]|uniref:Very short patch repair endonuclease n=2 Tax=Nibrella viscosa TaxID=1084524 RepID=A0ABP8KTL8_9BACT